MKFYQTYGQAAVHLVIGFIILGVIGFSVRMGIGGRSENAEADDSTHEIREIAGVEVRVSAEDRMFDENTEIHEESEPEPQPDELHQLQCSTYKQQNRQCQNQWMNQFLNKLEWI